MYQDPRRRKKVIKPRFYVICVIILLAVGVGLYAALKPEKSDLIVPGAATFSMDVRAVVVRDETMYSADNGEYGHIIYRALEGQEVTPGTPIARVYRWGYTEDIMQRLFDTEEEILSAQQQHLSGIITPELNDINARILVLLEQARLITAGEGNKSQSMLDVENDLKEAMQERITLLREMINPAPDELVLLMKQKTDAEETLSGWESDIVSAGNGAVSYYFDGYELAINKEKLDMLTPSLIEQAVNDRTFSALSGTASNVYKLSDPNHWYIAFVTPASDYMRLTQGESYHITFKGYETTPYTATASEVRTVEDKIINILEFNQSIGDFLSIRALEANIGGEFSGHKVDSRAIEVEKGVPQINVQQGENYAPVPVDVLAQQDGNCIVRPRDEYNLSDGMKYSLP